MRIREICVQIDPNFLHTSELIFHPLMAESSAELVRFDVRFEAQMSFLLADIVIRPENSRFVPRADINRFTDDLT